MVLMERAVNWALEELDIEGLGRSRPGLGSSALAIIGVKPRLKATDIGLGETGLFNLEPFSGPESKYDLGLDLYDIESSWKS